MRDTIRNLVEPLRNRNFRRFTFALTLGVLSLMFWVPFYWVYLIDKSTIDSGYYLWVVSVWAAGLATLASSRYWGLLIDRYGAKPVMAITYLAGT